VNQLTVLLFTNIAEQNLFMKKLLFFSLLSFLFACDTKIASDESVITGSKDSIVAENERLKQESSEKEEAINSFMRSFNEIQENLNVIKEKEKLVTTSAKTGDVKNNKDQIVEDIQLIYDLMNKNKQAVANMSGKLKKANLKIAELEKMITNLTIQLEQKDAEISDLREQLERMNLELSQLAINYEESEKTSAEKTSQLNTAFYAFGTSKELQTQGVITKEGGLIGIGKTAQLSKDFNKKYFTKIDVTETTTIPIAAKKAKILTNHPTSSYKLEGVGKVDKLVITNPDEFWSNSKYLVVIVEN